MNNTSTSGAHVFIRLTMWSVKFENQKDASLITTIATDDTPMKGEEMELHLSQEENNGRVFQKGFTTEQYAKETAPKAGGFGGKGFTPPNHKVAIVVAAINACNGDLALMERLYTRGCELSGV